MANAINAIYVGKLEQQNSVISSLVTEARGTSHGLFIVGGPARTGKNTTIERILDELKVEQIGRATPEINVYSDTPEMWIDSWQEAYRKGQRVFARGEIPTQFGETLNCIRNFYQSGIANEPDLRIFFNVINKEHPAWESVKIDQSIRTRLNQVFGEKDLHVHILEADKKRIVDELWKQCNLGWLDFKESAKQLGFKTRDFFQLEEDDVDLQDYNEFRHGLMQIMGEGSQSDPERR